MGNNINEMKTAYENIEAPAEALDRIKIGISKAKKENNKNKVTLYIKRTATTAATAVIAVTILANSSKTVTNAMERIPVIGAITKVVTIRNYRNKTANFEAQVNVPQITEEVTVDLEIETEEIETDINESLLEINKTIEDYADELIAMYEDELKASNGQDNYELVSTYEVIRNDEKYLSIRINSTVVMASGAQFVKIYNVDKTTGNIITLSDIYGKDTDYIDTISEEIKQQMQDQMAADENKIYFIKSDEEPSGFDKITDDTNFYINDDGNVVIVFDEYEVAPGYMGVVEFTLAPLS
jgi:hypothetical protein